MIANILLIASLIFLAVALLNLAAWPKLKRDYRQRVNEVSVLIPARNEEANLPACLDAVLKQGNAVKEILVYNDHSTDKTARVIDEYKKKDQRIRSVDSKPLAAGWCGKNFACDQLAKASDGDFLLFIDADARLSALSGYSSRRVFDV